MKTRMGQAAVTIVLAAQVLSVAAAENPFDAELKRRACKEYVAIHSEGEALEEAMASASDLEKLTSLFRLEAEQSSRLWDAEQPVINQLSDDEIERLREIASVQRSILTALEDGDWPFMGKVAYSGGNRSPIPVETDH